MLGKVKWYDDGRGIGLIEGENGADVMFNRTGVETSGYITFTHGMQIEFDLAKGRKETQAINLHVLS